MAKTRIEAEERKAITQIEISCLEAQTQLAVSGLTSEAAHGFVKTLPSITDLMPRLSFAEIAGEADPPIAAQLISSNALRQRRFRERQATLKAPPDNNVTEPLRNPNPRYNRPSVTAIKRQVTPRPYKSRVVGLVRRGRLRDAMLLQMQNPAVGAAGLDNEASILCGNDVHQIAQSARPEQIKSHAIHNRWRA